MNIWLKGLLVGAGAGVCVVGLSYYDLIMNDPFIIFQEGFWLKALIKFVVGGCGGAFLWLKDSPLLKKEV